MLNTYINDNHNVAYPFFGLEELPFALSCIVGMSIVINNKECFAPIDTPLYASNVYIEETKVSVTINDAKGLLLCTVDSKNNCTVHNSSLIYKNKPGIHAVIQTGVIPKDSYGSFSGKFIIDPSCVNIIPSDVYGNYDELTVNGVNFTINQALLVYTSGIITTEKDRLSPTFTISATKAASNVDLTDTTEYVDSIMVNSINGLQVRTGDGVNKTVLRIEVDIPKKLVGVDVTKRGSSTIDIVDISLHGTKNFPNCYSAEEDDANNE